MTLDNSLDVITVDKSVVGGRIASSVPPFGHETVDTFDVVCQGYDATGKDQYKPDYAEHAHGVQAEEANCTNL